MRFLISSKRVIMLHRHKGRQNLLLVALLASTTCALANPITITNSSRNVLSVRVNGQCSREFGVIKLLTSATVDEAALVRLCRTTSLHCIAEVYGSTTCQDRFIGYFYFNTGSGTSGEGSAVPPYVITIKRFEVVFSQ